MFHLYLLRYRLLLSSLVILSLTIITFSALSLDKEYSIKSNKKDAVPIIEKLEIIGDSQVNGAITKGDKKVKIKTIIRNENIKVKDICADLSQITGNPKDKSVRPLKQNIIIIDDCIYVNWFASPDKNMLGRDSIKVKVSARNRAGKLKDRSASANVFINPINHEIYTTRTNDGEARIEIALKRSVAGNTPFRIVVEPENVDGLYDHFPEYFKPVEGCKAYRIFAEDIHGSKLKDNQVGDAFTLGIEYPKWIRPELAQNLRLFTLSNNRWINVPSQTDISGFMVRAENIQSLGVYQLLAQESVSNEEIIAYPNPVQFGRFGDVSKTLKFINVPLGSVIEIYAVTGEKIREVKEPDKNKVEWDGTKDNGDLVTSGLYLYRIRVAGKDTYGKIAVLQ